MAVSVSSSQSNYTRFTHRYHGGDQEEDEGARDDDRQTTPNPNRPASVAGGAATSFQDSYATLMYGCADEAEMEMEMEMEIDLSEGPGQAFRPEERLYWTGAEAGAGPGMYHHHHQNQNHNHLQPKGGLKATTPRLQTATHGARNGTTRQEPIGTGQISGPVLQAPWAGDPPPHPPAPPLSWTTSTSTVKQADSPEPEPSDAVEVFYAPLAEPPQNMFVNEYDEEMGNVRRTATSTDSNGDFDEDILTIYPRSDGVRHKIPFVHFPTYMTRALWSARTPVDMRLEMGFLHFRRWRTLDPCLAMALEGEHRFLSWAMSVMVERVERMDRLDWQQKQQHHHHHLHQQQGRHRPFACFLRVLLACHKEMEMVVHGHCVRGMIIEFQADADRWLLPLSVVFECYDSGAQFRLTMTQPPDDGLGLGQSHGREHVMPTQAYSTDGAMAFQFVQQIYPFGT